MKALDVTRLAGTWPPVPDKSRSLPSNVQERRRLVGEFVANAFYGVMMKQMHDSKLKNERFHGGRGEEAFQGMLVQELSRRIGQSPTEPLARAFNAALDKQPGFAGPDSTENRP